MTRRKAASVAMGLRPQTRSSTARASPEISAIFGNSQALPPQAVTQDQVTMDQDNAHHELDQVGADHTIDMERQVAGAQAQVSTDAGPSSLHAQQALVAIAQGGSTAVDETVRRRASGEGAPFQNTGVTVATPAAVVSEPTSLAPVQVQALPPINTQGYSAARGDAGPSGQALVPTLANNASNQGAQGAPQSVCGSAQASAPARDTGTSFPQDQVREVCRTEDQVVIDGLTSRIEEAIGGLRIDVQHSVARTGQTEERIQGLAQAVNQVKSLQDIEGVLRELRMLRTDVNRLLEDRRDPRTVAAASTVQPQVATQSQEVVDQAQPSSQVVQDKFHIDEIVDPNEEFPPRPGKDSRRARKGQGRRGHKKKKGKRGRRRYDDDTSSSSESSDSESSSDEEGVNTPLCARTRPRGPKYEGLKELKPNNPYFDQALSYRTYRLENTDQERTSRQTGKVKDHIKRLQLTLEECSFDGGDPILILEFLSRFADEADTLEMSEAQAFIALPYFLKGNAASQFRSVKTTSSRASGGVSAWPEAVQYLLHTYATPCAIREAIQVLRSISQRSGESETDYGMRVAKASNRCGNVFPEWEKITLFVDGLDPTIRSLVARYREASRRGLSFEQLVHYAQDEGDTYRARVGAHRSRQAPALIAQPAKQVRLRTKDPRANALLAESSVEFRDDSSAHQGLTRQDHQGEVHFLGAMSSDHTSQLPTGSTVVSHDYDDADSALVMNQVPAPRVPYQELSAQVKRSRPGWRDNVERSTLALICHICYAKGHISPNCLLRARELATVIGNYEALSPEEKMIVPQQSYLQALAATRVSVPRESAHQAAQVKALERQSGVAQRRVDTNNTKKVFKDQEN